MPILALLRSLASILAIALLVAAVWLFADWYGGDPYRDADGVLRMERDGRLFWGAVALTAVLFLGRFPMLMLLARKDIDPMRPVRSHGRMIASPTGAQLYVEEHGPADAPVVVLTHGWSMDSTIWHYAKRDLAKQFRVVVWDLPGLGKSKRAAGKVSLSGFAEDLKAVVAHAGGRATLVGHSIGGMTIQTLARDDPAFIAAHVDRVALFNTTYTNPLHTMILSGLLRAIRKPVIVPMLYLNILLQPLVWASQWLSYLSGSQHLFVRFGFGTSVTRSQLDHTALLMTRNPPAVVAHGDLAMIRWDGSAGLPKLTVPTVVVGGDKDIVTKLEASEVIAGAVPGAELRVVEGANHMGPVERAGVYDAVVGEFVGS
jgi:pimeloyl-ACP methyl ester carboxylesterase